MSNVGQIYVIEFSTGLVKVGMSKDAAKRLRQHRADAGRFGIAITDQWLSAPHGSYLENEQRLIEWVAATPGSGRNGAEYFTGVEFRSAVAFAQFLVGDPARGTANWLTLSQVASRNDATVKRVKKWIKFGGLPADTAGTSWLVNEADLAAWKAAWAAEKPSAALSFRQYMAEYPYSTTCPNGPACAECVGPTTPYAHWWPQEKKDREHALLMSVLNSTWDDMSPAVTPTPRKSA